MKDIDLIGVSADGLSLANSAMLMALFDHLIAAGQLSRADLVKLLGDAAAMLSQRQNMTPAREAMKVINDKFILWAQDYQRP
jgi:hypothetical protein